MALTSTGLTLTNPPAGSDSFFELASTGAGFAAIYTRVVPNTTFPFTPVVSTVVRVFDASGKAGKEILLAKSGSQNTELIDLGGGKLLGIWPGGGNLQAALIDAKAGKVVKTADLGIKSGDNVMEIASLGGGKVALVATSIDIANPSDVRNKTYAYVLDAALKPQKGALLQDLPVRLGGLNVTVDHWQVVDRGAGAAAVWLDSADNLVYAQFLNGAGAAVGRRIVVSPEKLALPSLFETLFRTVKAVATPDGGFVVSWSGKTATSDGYDVWARVFDKNGKPGAAFRVNEATFQTQVNPEVTLLDNGRFAVSWGQTLFDGNNSGTTEWLRVFDAKGAALSGDIFLKDLPFAFASPPRNAEWVKLADGSLVAAFAEGNGLKAYGVPRILVGAEKPDKFGTPGDDIAVGNGGADRFTAGGGRDFFDGGAGADSYSAAGLHRNKANPTFDGVEAKAAADGVVKLAKPADGGGMDTLKNVESFTFTAFKDLIDFKALKTDTTIRGGAGDDWIYGGAGRDTIFGDAGNDLITASAGGDRLLFGPGSGVDKVFSFQADTVIDVSAYPVASFAALKAQMSTTATGDTLIKLSGRDSVTLVGIQMTSLNEGDFIL